MQPISKTRLAAAFLLTAAIMPTAPLLAAPDSGMVVEEIVITARLREESLQDVPDSITVLTEGAIRDAGIERPEDFIMLTPGVTMTNTAEIGDTQVSIRGINTGRDAEASFAYVVDGVLLTNPNAFNRELADVQQIEILKGPQGALYGRNALAGAIIVNTKKPGDETEGKLGLGIGNNSTQVLRGVVSGPLGESLAGRLSLVSRETDGHFRNDYLNKKVVDNYEEQALNARLIWSPTDTMAWDTRIALSQAEGAAIGYNASVHLVDAAAALSFPAFYQDVNDHKYQYLTNIEPENEQDNFNFATKFDYQLDWADLTGVFSYNDQENHFLTDGTSAGFDIYSNEPHCIASFAARAKDHEDGTLRYNPPFGYGTGDPRGATEFLSPYSPTTCDGYQYQERNQKDFSLELRFASPAGGGESVRWLGGVYFGDVEREVVVAQGEQTADDQGRERPIARRAYNAADSDSPTDLLYHDIFDSRIYALFGQVAYDLSPDLEVAFALRYDREERDVSNQVPNEDAATIDADGNGELDPINPAFRFNDTIDDRSKDFSQAQPKLTLNWKPADSWSLYASYGVGFRSGGFNSQGTKATIEEFYRGLTRAGETTPFDLRVLNINDEFEKEVSRSLELGLKSSWADGRFTLNAAAYNTDVDDMQFFEFYVGPFGLLRTVTNIDEVSIQGFELDANIAINDQLSLYAAGSWLSGEIEKSQNRPYTVGNEVPYAADSTYNLGATFNTDISRGWQMTARLDWAYVGDTWFHAVQANKLPNHFTARGFGEGEFSRTKRDPYDLFNLRVAFSSENLTVAAWGKNITDEEYLNEVVTAPEFGGSFVHDSPRQSLGVDLEYRF